MRIGREAPADRHADAVGDEGDRGEMARDDLAEIDVDEIAVVVDHGVERVDLAQHPHDLELLLVQRIAGEVALDRERVFHEARAVERADRVRVRDARRDHLAAARVARHEMRLDEPGRDAHVGFDEAAVELDRRAPRRREAEIDVRRIVARVVVLDAHRFEDPRVADDLGELLAFVRPMQARGDEHGDAFARHARRRCRPSISGRRNRWLGTGRVMSQIRMHALSSPAHERFVRRAPTGWASASRTAACGSASFASGRLPISVGCACGGSRTCIADLP